jgi:hypothetical protein
MIEITAEFGQFRKALIALVPVMQEAGIGWKTEEQYDSFDRISEALFTSFVADSLSEGPAASEILADYRYDFSPHSCPDGTAIRVVNSTQSGKFLRLSSNQTAFDSINCVSKNGMELDLPFQGSKFYI